jgi:hypothetical protein
MTTSGEFKHVCGEHVTHYCWKPPAVWTCLRALTCVGDHIVGDHMKSRGLQRLLVHRQTSPRLACPIPFEGICHRGDKRGIVAQIPIATRRSWEPLTALPLSPLWTLHRSPPIGWQTFGADRPPGLAGGRARSFAALLAILLSAHQLPRTCRLHP